MEFKLTIKLGNDAVQTGRDIARLLGNVIAELEDIEEPYRTARRIRDDNSGMKVGEWMFSE